MSIALAIRRLQATRPAVGRVVVPPKRGYEMPTHPLVGAGVPQVDRILQESERGVMARLIYLYEDMRERDGRLDAVCRTRVLAVSGKRWRVRPTEDMQDDPEAQRVAEGVSRILSELEELPLALGQLMDAVLRGYAVLEIEWGISRRGQSVPMQLHWLHPARFNFTADMQIVKYDAGQDRYPGTPLSSFGNDKFIVHMPHAGRSAYPVRRGALRSTVFPTLTKRYGLRWWLRAAERFGQPAPYVKVPEGNDDLFDAATEMLRNLTDDWQVVLTERMDIGTVDGSGQFTGELHSRLVELVNTEVSIAVLGQNLTTEVQGGSFAAAKAHEFVRHDYLMSDAAELQATLRSQLIEPIVRYNWPGAPVPDIEFVLVQDDVREPQPWHFENAIVDANEVRESLGMGPREDDEASTKAEQAVNPAAALNGAQIASLLQIISAVATGQLPRATGIQVMAQSFPFDATTAELIMGEVGRTFTITIDPMTGEPSTGEPAQSPAAVSVDASRPVGRTDYDGPFAYRTATPSTTSPTSGLSTNPLVRALLGMSDE